jgi:HlyD family secretion protein
MKKIIIILVIILVPATIGGYYFLKKEKNIKIEWETKVIEQGNMDISITATGTLEAVTEVEVGTQVSGIISKIYVDFNSPVRKGQIIARLDTTTLASQVFDSRANYKRKEIMLNQAKRNLDRSTELYEEKVMAQVEYDKVLDDFETAQSNLISAEAQLKRAQINLGYATVTSPIDGIVISRNIEQGQTVASSFNSPTLFHIVNDLTKMQVEASIDEADIGQIEEGQSVTFTVDAYPDDVFTGEVRQKRLNPVIVSNVVNYIVIVDVPNPDMKLMPGMTASISVLIDERIDILKVPTKALSFRPPASYLAYYQENLPDSIKQVQNERMNIMKERMKSMGMSDEQIEERIKSFSQRGMMGGGFSGGARGQGSSSGFMGQRGTEGTMGPMQGVSSQRNAGFRARQFGMVWVKVGDDVKPVRVRTGLNDGIYSEVFGNDVEEGMEVVISAIYDEEKEKKQQQRSPFMPQFGRGMGGRRR